MAAHLGLMPWMFGDALAAPPSVDDIGRVAAAALMDPQSHAGRTYRPTGPALLSGGDMAAILSRVFGRTVRAVPTPLWVYLRAAYRYGESLALLSCMEHYAEESRRGAFAIGAPNEDIARVTGRPAESFETVARRLAALPVNQRSPSRSLREFADFLTVPFIRMPNTQRYLRGLQIVAPRLMQYVSESEVWSREHGIAKTSAVASIVGCYDDIAAT